MDRKYRILLFIRWPVGGIRTFIRYVYNNFDHALYRFTLIAPDLPELALMLDDLRNLDVAYVPFREYSSRLRVMALLTKTILFGKFDLIHSHGFTAGIYSALPARLNRTKHVMTSHDVLLPKQFEGLNGFLKKAALSILLPMIDVIHSVTTDAHKNLLEFVPSLRKRGNKCIVIQNGIEIERFQCPEKRHFRRELNLPEDTFLIGFLGRFMSQKGFIYLIGALELLLQKPNLKKHPVILTFGSSGFIREDRSYIDTRGLKNYFYFLPFASNVSSILKGLDVVVMPSLWEACGLLAMEVMVAGTPFIGTQCIGLSAILQNTPCAMVPPRDSLSLANAIEQEINQPSQLRAKAFSDEAARRFDVRSQAEELEKLTLTLLNQK